jgi:hypothetical protein
VHTSDIASRKGYGVADPKRVPAFGARVYKNRCLGRHPLFIKLLYGDDWREAFLHQRLAKTIPPKIEPYTRKWVAVAGWPVTVVSPREYERGSFDLRIYAGVDVEVIDQAGGLEVELVDGGKQFGKCFDLLCELAAIAASVRARGVHERDSWDVDTIAFTYRYYDHRVSSYVDPPWWTADLKREYEQRKQRHLGDLVGYAAR